MHHLNERYDDAGADDDDDDDDTGDADTYAADATYANDENGAPEVDAGASAQPGNTGDAGSVSVQYQCIDVYTVGATLAPAFTSALQPAIWISAKNATNTRCLSAPAGSAAQTPVRLSKMTAAPCRPSLLRRALG